jgi:hypothetical protein
LQSLNYGAKKRSSNIWRSDVEEWVLCLSEEEERYRRQTRV